MQRTLLLIAVLVAGVASRNAHAAPLVPGDEFQRPQSENRTVVDGQGGGWTAARLVDAQGRTILCMATSDRRRLTLTANKDALELRINDPSVVVSPGALYPMTLTVGPLKQDLEMETDGPSTVRTDPLDPADLITLLDAMGHAKRVLFDQSGNADRAAPLAGSAAVLSRFRACATMAGFARLES